MLYLEAIEIKGKMHETRKKHEKGNEPTRPVKCQGKKEENSFWVGKPLVLIIIQLTGRRRVGSGRVRGGTWTIGISVVSSLFPISCLWFDFWFDFVLHSHLTNHRSRTGGRVTVQIQSKDFSFSFLFDLFKPTKWWWISAVVSAHVCGRIIADQSQASSQSADRWHWISSSPVIFFLKLNF